MLGGDERDRWGGSPAAARDLALLALVCAVSLVGLAAAAVLMVGLAGASALLGAPWTLPPPGRWAGLAWTVLTHAADPGAGVAGSWARVAGHPVLYWALTGAVGVAALLALVPAGFAGWRRWGPTPAGHASRVEVRGELSLQACRRTARITRPDLPAPDRRRAPGPAVGVPLPVGPIGPLWLPLENTSGDLAPTQAGKSRRSLMWKVLAAPGALLCSTTKPDLLAHTALERARMPLAGPVLVFDATTSVIWPALLRWSPVAGCADPAVAGRRARTMVEAAAVSVETGGGTGAGNDRVFRDRAHQVLANYLIAAAIEHSGIAEVLGWALTRDDHPADVLERASDPDLQRRAANLRADAHMVADTSDAVWMVLRRVLEPFQDPTLRTLCTPEPGREIDLRGFIANRGSLYLIAGEREHGGAVAVLTALAEEWIDTARTLAGDQARRRLAPPATAVLDELANATPIPSLPASMSDTAGRGVLIHWAAQSKAQLDVTFGREQAAMLLDNTTALAVWGGLKDGATLEWVSTALGWRDRDRWQTHHEGAFTPPRATLGTESVPVYRAGDVRTIPRYHVVIVYRTLRAIAARTLDISRHPRWAQLHADVAALDSAEIPIDAAGYLLDTGAHQRVVR